MKTLALSISLLVLLSLAAAGLARAEHAPARPDRFELIPEDTLLYVDNRGAERVFVELNGRAFKLVSDPAEVSQSRNAFLIPRSGDITISVATLLRAEGENYIELSVQGPTGADAEFIVANVLLFGQEVAYAIDQADLQELPEQLDLLQSYPNPFRSAATITYTIPAERTSGLPVRLVIYDALGRRVAVLVDDRRFPGTFTTRWTPAAGSSGVAPGVYFCRLVAGDRQQTIKLVYLR